MTVVSDATIDETDWKLIEALQADARQSYTALGRCIGLSRPAVAERVRRLEEIGVITGYRATIDPAKLGLTMTAFIRLSTNTRSEAAAFSAFLLELPEVQECYRGTGGDCFTIKVLVASLAHLDVILERIRDYGNPTTSIMLAALVTHRDFVKPGVE